MSARPKLRIDESLTNADWTKRTDDHLDGGPSLKKQIGAELETTTVTFEVIEFSVACDEHDEFACRDSKCRPPTSGGTGGSLPERRTGDAVDVSGSRLPLDLHGLGSGELEPEFGFTDQMDGAINSALGVSSRRDWWQNRDGAKILAQAAVANRMANDPEFKQWLDKVLDTPLNDVIRQFQQGFKVQAKETLPDGLSDGRAQKLDEPQDWNSVSRLDQWAAFNKVFGFGMDKSLVDWDVDGAGTIRDLFHESIVPLETIIAPQLANGLIRQWAETSGDSDFKAIAMQLATASVHGLQRSVVAGYTEKDVLTMAEKHFEKFKAPMKAFVRAEYEATQSMLRSIGVTEMVVARGMKEIGGDFKVGEQVSIESNPASSWAFHTGSATAFTSFATDNEGMIMVMRVPVSAIQSTPVTGRGCLVEDEVLILGGKATSTVVWRKAKGEEV